MTDAIIRAADDMADAIENFVCGKVTQEALVNAHRRYHEAHIAALVDCVTLPSGKPYPPATAKAEPWNLDDDPRSC